MAAADLAAADPVASALAWLSTHPDVADALGGDGRVGGRNAPPYPRLLLSDPPGGSDRDLRWLLAPELSLRVLGDYDGTPGKAALRRILYRCLGALTELADAAPAPGAPVVTAVVSSASGGWRPEPDGQPAYAASVRMYMHPPVAVP